MSCAWASLGQRPDLVGGVDGAELGRLRDRDDARLDCVLVAEAGEPRRDRSAVELAVGRRDGQQLHPGDPLGRPALVDVQVGGLGADHGLLTGERPEREDVGAGAVEDEERVGLGAEVVAQALRARRRSTRHRRRRRVAVVGGRIAARTSGGRRRSCRRRSRACASRVQREPLAVHLRGRVGEEEGDRVGDVLCGGERGEALSGFSARISGVRIAFTTTMFAVAPVGRRSSARASVQPRPLPWRRRRRRSCRGSAPARRRRARSGRVRSRRAASWNARVVCWTVRTRRSWRSA